MSWKSGNVVRLLSGGEVMTVIGCDSVGSVICRPLNDHSHLGIYVPPSLLMTVEAGPDRDTSANSLDMVTENA